MSVRAQLLYSKFEAAFEFQKCVMDLISLAINEHCSSTSDFIPYEKFETKYRLQLNVVLKGSTLTKEEKRLARIGLKACFVLLAYDDYQLNNSSLIHSEATFLTNYPELRGAYGLPLLVKFRNIIAVSLTLLEAENNKSKHLIIATRLSEGKHVRYITGSGQTEATTQRVMIFEKESRLQNIISVLCDPSHFVIPPANKIKPDAKMDGKADSAKQTSTPASITGIEEKTVEPPVGAPVPKNSALLALFEALEAHIARD